MLLNVKENEHVKEKQKYHALNNINIILKFILFSYITKYIRIGIYISSNNIPRW